MEKTTSSILTKTKIHVGFLILFLALNLNHLVLFELIDAKLINLPASFSTILLALISLLLTLLSALFLKCFIKKKWLYVFYMILLIVCVVFQIIGLNINIASEQKSLQHYLMIIAFAICVFIFMVILFITVKDIFVEKHDFTYALLGAANLFFLIILTFSFIIALLVLCFPFLLPEAKTVSDIFNMTFVISSYSIAGIDFPYANIPKIIKNITAFQSILVHLYAVMIVGRLLSR